MNIFGWDFYKKSDLKGFSKQTRWGVPPKNQKLLKSLDYLMKYNQKFESSGKEPKVLLISRPTTQIAVLIHKLKKTKTTYLYINPDELIHGATLHLEGKTSFFKYKNKKINLSKIKSAYVDYSELLEVYHFSKLRFTPKERVFMSRWIQAFDSLESIVPNWYPCAPSQLKFEIQNKYNDSILAQKLGLPIPKMILTNEVSAAKDFIRTQKSVLKETGIHFYSNNKKQLFYFHVDVVNENSKTLKNISKTPCFFQEYVEKEKEVRAVVVGKKVLAVQIESQKDKRSKINWKGTEENLEFSVCKLPKSLEKKLIQLVEQIGFHMATMDLVVTPRGQYYFIEINRPGQWLFLELLSGVDVSSELVRLLK